MFTSFHRRLLTTFLISSLFSAFPALTSADHSWGTYHWARKSNPFTLKLGDNVSLAWDTYLNQTMSDWSQSPVLNTTIVTGGTTPRKCRPTSGRVEVCNSTYGNNGWLGIAQIWASGSHITQGVTKLNDTYFNTSAYNTPAWRNLVMCQEVGHIFGLDHQDENFYPPNLGTCMDYTNDPGGYPSNEHPNAHDYEQLETIYTHLDNTTTVSQATAAAKAPPAMRQIDFATRAQWGRLVRSINEGRTEVYELDFGMHEGKRHKVFTFVIWVEGEERGQQ